MRAPGFWYEEPGLRSAILAPLGAMYAAATARRLATGPKIKPGVRVICVGNINAGGTGKTPTVIAVIEALIARGQTPVVLSRGYGGRLAGPIRVDPARHTAADVGDEPLLLAAFAPVWVARDRGAGARAAVAAGASVIVMDDGFQNGSVAQDLKIVVVDAARGFGNCAVIPAGPLREPLETGLSRADLLVSIGREHQQAEFQKKWPQTRKLPRLEGHIEPLQTGMDWADMDVIAFAGIGHPEKFFETLRSLGANIVESHALDDHQTLSAALMRRLTGQARASGARLVSTEKDAVRLPQSLRTEGLTLPVRLRFKNAAPLETAFTGIGL